MSKHSKHYSRDILATAISLSCGPVGIAAKRRLHGRQALWFSVYYVLEFSGGRWNVPFFSNADIPVAYETLAWIQAFLVDPHPGMKRSRDITGEPICPFAKPVLAENALYMTFHREVNGKSAELI